MLPLGIFFNATFFAQKGHTEFQGPNFSYRNGTFHSLYNPAWLCCQGIRGVRDPAQATVAWQPLTRGNFHPNAQYLMLKTPFYLHLLGLHDVSVTTVGKFILYEYEVSWQLQAVFARAPIFCMGRTITFNCDEQRLLKNSTSASAYH